jgi:hypothetical protein
MGNGDSNRFGGGMNTPVLISSHPSNATQGLPGKKTVDAQPVGVSHVKKEIRRK